MTEARIPLRVECRAERQGTEEEPCTFWLGERKVGVLAVLDRWLAPGHRYFKLLGDDHATYLIRHDVPTADWELILYETEPPIP